MRRRCRRSKAASRAFRWAGAAMGRSATARSFPARPIRRVARVAATIPTPSMSMESRRLRAAPPAAMRTEAGRRSGGRHPDPKRLLNAPTLILTFGQRFGVWGMADAPPNRKLREYLLELRPEARALLASEIERALLRGEA